MEHVTLGGQHRAPLRRKPFRLDFHTVGPELVMVARHGDQPPQIDPRRVQVFEDGEQHLAHDARAAGRAHDQHAPLVFDEGRRHAGKRALAGLDAVGRRTAQAKRVRDVGGEREIVHLVVEQHAGVAADHAGAEQ
ncbi:hypothetical protein D3C83_36700 [compost metagenome]